MTASDELNGAAAARGHVQQAATGAVDPAEVVLFAWPTVGALDSMDVGDELGLIPLARDVVDKNGNFELRVDPKLVTSNITNERDFEIVATSGQLTGVDGFTGKLTMTDPGVYAIERSYPNSKDAVEIALQHSNVAEASTSHERSSYSAAAGLVKDYGPRWVAVGATYNTVKWIKSDFAYFSGADSSLGVGYSASGSAGSFSQDYTVTRSSGATINFPALKTIGKRHFDTKYRYGKYIVSACGAKWCTTWYEARPISFAGGTRSRTPSGYPRADYCVVHEGGSSFVKSTTNAVNWRSGVAIGGAIGVNLSARTGYRSDAWLKFVFSTKRRLCGVQDYPGGAPGRLVGRGY